MYTVLYFSAEVIIDDISLFEASNKIEVNFLASQNCKLAITQ